MRYAVIMKSHVVNIVDVTQKVANDATMHGLLHVECGPDVAVRWRYVGGGFYPPSRWESLEDAKSDLQKLLRARRIEAEVTPYTVGAVSVRMDPEARAVLRELKAWSDDNPAELIPVEDINGRVRRVGRTPFLNALQGMYARHKSILDAAETKSDEVDALTTLTEAEQYDLDAGWPT